MKTLVIFYSYTGNSKRLAREFANKESADIAEVKDIRRPGMLKAYSLGCIASIRGKSWPIQPLELDWKAYDHLVLYSPVWAGGPPPAIHALLDKLPKGKTVSVKMVSGSGRSSCKAKMEEAIKNKGCTPKGFVDIKA